MAATAGAIHRRERGRIMGKLWKHIKAWNYWRKGNLNSPLHKIAVLFGAYSPSFIGVKAGMDVAEKIEQYYRSGGE